MAVTTTTTATEFLFPEILSAFIIPNLYSYTSAIPLARIEDWTGKPTLTVSWPVAPALTSGDLTEAVDTSPSTVTPTALTATLEEVGIALELTDLLMDSDILSGADWYADQMLQAQEVKVNTDHTALYSGFATTVGSTGVAFSETTFLDAINKLEVANAPKPYDCVVKAKNLGDLRKTLFVPTAANTTNHMKVGHVSDVAGQTRPYGPVGPGAAFEHAGVWLHVDNTITTQNAGADNANAMYSRNFALGYAHKWQNRIEYQRRAVGRSTSVVLSTIKTEKELKDAAGVNIIAAV